MAGSPPNGSSGSNDDDLEISIEGRPAAAPAPAPQPRKRARTPNPVADEVIHTGEIPESPRSLIIRSSPSIPVEPKIQIREEPTEPVTPVRPMVPPTPAKSRLPLVIGAAVVLGGGIAALAVSLKGNGGTKAAPAPVQQAAPAGTSNVSSLADFVGTTLDADAHAAMVRAEAIASSSMLRAGIETDAKTLADMAKDNDVTFPIKPGEVVDVIQVKDGGRTSLLHWPAEGPQIPPAPAGKMQLAQINGVLTVVATAAIPKRQGSSVSGEIVIAVPIDLEVIRKKVTIPSTIVGVGSPVVIVGGAQGANKQTVKIDTEMKAPISLEATP